MERTAPTIEEDRQPTTGMKDLRGNTSLWYKIHVFVYDLRNYEEMDISKTRLDQIIDSSYIGPPYFTTTEVSQLKSTIISIKETQTLEQYIEKQLNARLERRKKKRVESGDFRVCAAHDLGLIFEKAFDIKHKELAKDGEFLTILKRSGLELQDGDRWQGVPKKTFQKNIKKKKR
ncbi:hypothetical protein LSUE1_G007859 [Lachnellula suecica]|uniref:Uncharacterized protein n=1 Tax=Lachnellula suecica TaxID=602035 RepID=A0A8T9BX22_9HELO|nr:hypothetical protein LSUE1_G007859 [Lachnellula suecica]